MRSDWANPPTLEGIIEDAYFGEDGMADMLYIKATDVANDPGNLGQVFDDLEDPDRPWWLIGRAGTLKKHGIESKDELLGRKCLVYSGGRYDKVAIEPNFGVVVWGEYAGVTVEDLLD
jgi:hypothetical protein